MTDTDQVRGELTLRGPAVDNFLQVMTGQRGPTFIIHPQEGVPEMDLNVSALRLTELPTVGHDEEGPFIRIEMEAPEVFLRRSVARVDDSDRRTIEQLRAELYEANLTIHGQAMALEAQGRYLQNIIARGSGATIVGPAGWDLDQDAVEALVTQGQRMWGPGTFTAAICGAPARRHGDRGSLICTMPPGHKPPHAWESEATLGDTTAVCDRVDYEQEDEE